MRGWLTTLGGDLGRLLRENPWNLLGCALAWIYALPSAWYPFGSDQGIHWYLGNGILHGQLPYLSGGISGKPPVIFVIHAFATLLFGQSQAAIRLLEMSALPVLGFLIARCARFGREGTRGCDGEMGAATVLVSAANYTYEDYWNTAHPEFWMGVALMAALDIALYEKRPVRRAYLAGLLCTLGFALKYTAAAIAFPISVVCGVHSLQQAQGWKQRVLAVPLAACAFVFGILTVFALCVLPYVLTGTVRQMREVCVDMTENYTKDSPKKLAEWKLLAKNWRTVGTLVSAAKWFAVVGLVVALVRRRFREVAPLALCGVLLATAVYSVILQARFFSYHWIVTFPFFVLAIAWGLRQLTWQRGFAQVLLATLMTAWVFRYAPTLTSRLPTTDKVELRAHRTYKQRYEKWLDYAQGKLSADQLAMTFERNGSSGRYADILVVGKAIRARAKPGDTLCLGSFNSPIYQITGLRCPSRHAIGSFVSLGPRSWRTEYEHDLETHPPTFFAVVADFHPYIRDFKKRGYDAVGTFGGMTVLERRAAK